MYFRVLKVYCIFIRQFVYYPTTMSGKQVLANLKTKEPQILLQRAEETYPALKDSTVSVACMK